MKRLIPLLLTAVCACACRCPASSEKSAEIQTWGDQGNGTYINPILNADYSDPDVTRVGDTYYLVASDFHFMGMQILESKDLVNWKLVTQLFDRLDAPGYDTMQKYACGTWAPSIRYHDGRFYVFVCTPTEGLYMMSAEKAEGPWTTPLLVHEGTGRGWEDPCPFWDEDGQAYLGRSNKGAGPIIIHRMSADGTTLLDEGEVVYRGPVAEGTKIHKINGWYYISIPEGGVGGGWQTVLRSKDIYGPYERKVVLETGSTDVNGPHQGAIVDTPDGQWWFFHFQRTPTLGRVVHLQPMHWEEDWPVIGVDIDRNGIGEPVYCWKMPVEGTTPSKPASSDDFNSTGLAPQWQFNHNPVDGAWSLSENPGTLTLHGLRADAFVLARNTVTQKLMGYKGCATVRMDVSKIIEGQRCGLAVMSNRYDMIGVRRQDGRTELYYEGKSEVRDSVAFSGKTVWLKLDYDTNADDFHFSYSTNNRDFTVLGDSFQPRFGNWKGARPALYNYNVVEDGGTVCFDDFTMTFN